MPSFPEKGRWLMCCVQCNSTELVQNHHVIPKADGGVDETIPLCRSCHLKLHGINGDFKRWTSAWHQYYREVDPEGYHEHQRKAGRARQSQLRRWGRRRENTNDEASYGQRIAESPLRASVNSRWLASSMENSTKCLWLSAVKNPPVGHRRYIFFLTFLVHDAMIIYGGIRK